MKARGKQTSVFLSRRALSTAASRASVGPTAPQSGVAGFPKTPKKRNRYWANEDNQRRQLEQIAEKIGVNQPSDWYGISRKDIEEVPEAKVLFKYHSSLADMLRNLYPNQPWDASQFRISHRWRDANVQKQFLDQIAKELKIEEPSGWYAVSKKEVIRRGGGGLLKLYNSSMEELLRSVYPAYPWNSALLATQALQRAPYRYWHNTDNILSELDKVEQRLGITQPEDWYSVTIADMREVGISRKVTKPKLAELLAQKYPDYPWEKVIFLKGRFAKQKKLERTVATLFPEYEIMHNVRKEVDLIHPDTGDSMELDIYIKSLNLAFEYQEAHHYKGAQFLYTPQETILERDRIKKELAEAKGITLVVVPFWWDGRNDSVIATIKNARPDLLTDRPITADPIPTQMPQELVKSGVDNIVDIGEPTTACFFTLSSIDPKGWWVFEKYDGIRGFWNPSKKRFYSRRGNILPLPNEIVNTMPDVFLDGEIWFGRDNFEESMKIPHRTPDSRINWTQFKYMVFDLPKHNGSYRERYEALAEQVGRMENPFIQLATKEICNDVTHLDQLFQDIVDQGGEGVILRDPNGPLQPGRSGGYLKYKKFRDGEAKVIGKHGAHEWECELPNGIRFVAPGTSAFGKKYDPQSGEIVTFKHRGYLQATKKPKFPTLFRIRSDITWDDVMQRWKEKKIPKSEAPLRRAPTRRQKARGYWEDRNNLRQFLLETAKEMCFDPYQVGNWDTISLEQVAARKGGDILTKYGSLVQALQQAFLEIDKAKQVRDRGR